MLQTLNPNVNVLFDIDGTLINDTRTPQIDSRYVMGNALFEIFSNHLTDGGMSRLDASQLLYNYAQEKVYWDYDDFVRRFQIPEPEIWDQLILWHDENLEVYADGIQLVHRLFDLGYPLHIVSNNPRIGCLLKLKTAGLGTLQGSSYFRSIFCSNHQLGQKFSVEFWQRILTTSKLVPSQTVIVGNNPHEDYEVPRQLGFYASYIVDRDHIYDPEPSGPFLVRDLREVELLLAHSQLNELKT